jgi:hypothetical protein
MAISKLEPALLSGDHALVLTNGGPVAAARVGGFRAAHGSRLLCGSGRTSFGDASYTIEGNLIDAADRTGRPGRDQLTPRLTSRAARDI